MKLNILFLGTPSFAALILEALHSEHTVVAVITPPDKPVGREQQLTPPVVKTKALSLGLPVFQPEKASEIPLVVQGKNFDFLITAAYGKYLPQEVLQLPQKDALNVHASLLPKYRGATPLQSALLNGDQESGVSIIRMANDIDTGKIFLQEKIVIPPDMRYPWLEKVSSALGAKLLLKVLQDYDSITPWSQDEDVASTCKKIEKEDGRIDFGSQTALQIFNRFRAFDPWPGIFTTFEGRQLRCIDIGYTPLPTPDFPPGTVHEHSFSGVDAPPVLLVKTREGSISLNAVQVEGKKAVLIKNFVNGYRHFIGSRLPS